MVLSTERAKRTLLWALVLSLLLHLAAAPLFAWLLAVRANFTPPKGELQPLTVTSSVRIERRDRPQIRRKSGAVTPRTAARIAVPRLAPPVQRIAVRHPQPAVARHELSVFAKHAPPAQLSPQSLALDQHQFAAAIARARDRANPLSGSGSGTSVGPPKHYGANLSDVSFGSSGGGEGVLTPLKTWKDGPYTYYYVRYYVRLGDGSIESGVVPWPIRYLPANDPFANRTPHFPLPGPLPDYVAPTGTDMQPMIRSCYERRPALC